MPEFPFNDEKYQSPKKRDAFLKIMESDSSGANVHAVFTNYCGGGWAEGLGRICKDTPIQRGTAPITFNCIQDCVNSPRCMAAIVTHEIGHVLGKKLLLTASTNLPKFLSFFSAYIYIKK